MVSCIALLEAGEVEAFVSLNAGCNWDLSLAIALCVTLYAGDTGGAGDDALCSPYAEDAGGDALCAMLEMPEVIRCVLSVCWRCRR